MAKKIGIIGAGPAGMFAARKLKGLADIVVYDEGREANARPCPKTKTGICINCNPCNVTHGIGGAGLNTDGKLMYDIRVGNNLNEIIVPEKNQLLVDEVEQIFSSYGVQTSQENIEKVEQLKRKALQNRVDFIYPRQAHVGSNNLPGLMQKFKEELENEGVEFRTSYKVKSIEELSAENDFLLLAPGRSGGGEGWLENILLKQGVEINYRPVDIGTRVETDSTVTKEVTDVTRDMKFYFTPDAFPQARVRTFCTCPNGFVAQEKYDRFVTVNGHAESLKEGKRSPNTNFAILVTVNLTKPQSNSNENARHFAEYINNLGGNQITAVRWGDYRRNKRSDEEKQGMHFLQPTLKGFNWGSAYFLPMIYHEGIKDAMHRLDGIMPGLANDSTILYLPEIKFHGLRISTDENLRVTGSKKPIYVAGDGSGFTRGIVGAAASGLLAAEGISKYLN
jgi:uncharacterized FAD-dependent dehydrogenase